VSFTNGKLHGFGVAQDAYRAQTAKRGEPGYVIGRSDLHEIASCPWRWLHADGADDGTPSTEWGTLVDAMLFGGDISQFVIAPETYMGEDRKKNPVEKPWNWNATVCQEWREAQGGKQIVKAEVWEAAESAAALFMADPQLSYMMSGAQFQAHVTADWTDKETGIIVPVKTLIDVVPMPTFRVRGQSALADGKTARNGAAGAWPRVCFDGWYHVQAAMYLDVWKAANPSDERTTFLHAIVENVAPYAVGRREIADQLVRLGRAQYEAALAIYAKCIATNEWPGLDDAGEWTPVDAEPWMMMRAGVAPTDGAMPEMAPLPPGAGR
jgi:hypothetical protein